VIFIVVTDKGHGPGLNRAVINWVAEINRYEEATKTAKSNHERIRHIKARLRLLEEVEETMQIKLMRLEEEYKAIMKTVTKEIEGLYSHAKKFNKDPTMMAQVKPLLDSKQAEMKAIGKEVEEIKGHIKSGAKRSIKMVDMIRRYA